MIGSTRTGCCAKPGPLLGDSGTGVSPVRFDPNRPDARATRQVMDVPNFVPRGTKFGGALPMNRSASCPNSQRVESPTASNNSTGICNGDALRLGTSRAPVQGFNARSFRAILSPTVSSIAWRRRSGSSFAALGPSVSIRGQEFGFRWVIRPWLSLKLHQKFLAETGGGISQELLKP